MNDLLRCVQASVFRTFQGWLALRYAYKVNIEPSHRADFSDSDTAPTQGTLKVFPSVYLSNAYLILRPFFKLKENLVTKDQLDPENWELGKP